MISSFQLIRNVKLCLTHQGRKVVKEMRSIFHFRQRIVSDFECTTGDGCE